MEGRRVTQFIIEGNQGRTSCQGFEAGTEVQVLEEYQLLAHSPYLPHLAILYHPGPLPKRGLILSDVGPPTLIGNQENEKLNSL